MTHPISQPGANEASSKEPPFIFISLPPKTAETTLGTLSHSINLLEGELLCSQFAARNGRSTHGKRENAHNPQRQQMATSA